ncbi:CsgG/HfaB family protein [Halanaerobacter jeridensis]|uniref:Curli biogenesis system outer membrane secretion channel CsgG n=1 Tax=Halanaerobacter jeridensis TaxID=706427 RepID=A0A939BSX2_9FIRM|nr:CsgG/HfaB family protein [Halanaerobacter jeridensis]MBM7557601.1 curli biogenesis system outer membrane secretion channel CsgG [Halanaerobacter jeridensis]
MKNIKKVNILAVIILILITFSGKSFAQQNLIAVMPVKEGDLSWHGFNEDEILQGMTQEITDKLVSKDKIKVIERTRLKKVIEEQKLGQSGLLDSTTAAKLGRILGVDSIVLTTLTYMEVEKGVSFGVGPFKTSGVKAKVTLTGRLVDTTTAEIKSSFKGQGKASDRSFKISNYEGVSFGSKAFKKSALGKSINKATDSFVSNLAKELKNNNSTLKTGKIVKVMGNKLIIKVDPNNLMVGKTAKVVKEVEVEELDNPVTMKIGEVKIINLTDEAVVAEILKEEESIVEGQLVQF